MSDPSPRLARSAGLFGLATMTSRLLGLVRDQVLSYYFGAGDANDAFRVAFRVPNLTRDLFAEGAMSAAFVPVFTRHLAHGGKPRAWQLANSVLNALLLVTGALVALGIVFAEPLLRLLAGGFAEVPGKFPLTVQLTRIMLPFLTLVALAAAVMGMLNSLGHFFIPALSPAMFNVATVVMALTLIPIAPSLGVEPIMIIAVSALVGGFGQLALQWPPLVREGFRYRPTLDVRDEGLRQVLLLMGPGTIGLAATQINVFVNLMLATSEGTGAVTWLDLAFRLMYLPIGLFGVSIAAATTPAVSRYAASADVGKLRSTVASGIALMLVLNVPALFGLVVLAEPIVALIFEYGNFTAADSRATAGALQFYALGLVGYSLVRIVTPTFYALQRSRIPVAASVASIAINIALNLALVRVLGYRGLALGTSLTALLNGALQIWLLRRHLGGIDGRRIASTLGRILIAAMVMAAVAWATERSLQGLVAGDGFAARLIRVGASIGAGLAVLAIVSHLLRVPEVDEARTLVWRRLWRKTS
jgi:putative peptidoglycan lipid II flippase